MAKVMAMETKRAIARKRVMAIATTQAMVKGTKVVGNKEGSGKRQQSTNELKWQWQWWQGGKDNCCCGSGSSGNDDSYSGYGDDVGRDSGGNNNGRGTLVERLGG
jgi:hypothetical protein